MRRQKGAIYPRLTQLPKNPIKSHTHIKQALLKWGRGIYPPICRTNSCAQLRTWQQCSFSPTVHSRYLLQKTHNIRPSIYLSPLAHSHAFLAPSKDTILCFWFAITVRTCYVCTCHPPSPFLLCMSEFFASHAHTHWKSGFIWYVLQKMTDLTLCMKIAHFEIEKCLDCPLPFTIVLQW